MTTTTVTASMEQGERLQVNRASAAKLLVGVSAVVASADLFLWDSVPGLGLALFMSILWGALFWNRSFEVRSWKDWLVVALMVAAVAQTGIETGLANGLVLVMLTLYASGHFLFRQLHPWWRRALEGVTNFAWLPASLFRRETLGIWRQLDVSGLNAGSNLKKGLRIVSVVLPAAIICVPFAIFLLGGNAILWEFVYDFLDSILLFLVNLEVPSVARMAFWIVIGCLSLGLLGKGRPSRLLSWGARQNWIGLTSKDHSLSIWRTRLILIGVNVLFFFANSTDALFLWAEASLPEGVTFSDFVHRGVYSLIASVLLAALVLSLLFVQNEAICNAKGVRAMAHLWIVQNLLLVSSVILRLKLYVEAYQMSLLRIYVVGFLCLVVVGFVLLAFRVQQNRSLGWLLGGNLLAVFVLFFAMQIWDEHRFVANWNYAAVVADSSGDRTLDSAYLGKLGSSAWPVLAKVAEDPQTFGRWAAEDASTILSQARSRYDERARDWRNWQWRRHANAQVLP